MMCRLHRIKSVYLYENINEIIVDTWKKADMVRGGEGSNWVKGMWREPRGINTNGS